MKDKHKYVYQDIPWNCGTGSKFKTNHPIYKSDPVLDAALQENGVITSYEEVEQPSVWSQLLVGAFPIILLLAIFFFQTSVEAFQY